MLAELPLELESWRLGERVLAAMLDARRSPDPSAPMREALRAVADREPVAWLLEVHFPLTAGTWPVSVSPDFGTHELTDSRSSSSVSPMS